jgi:hypothetical protein
MRCEGHGIFRRPEKLILHFAQDDKLTWVFDDKLARVFKVEFLTGFEKGNQVIDLAGGQSLAKCWHETTAVLNEFPRLPGGWFWSSVEVAMERWSILDLAWL